MPKTISNALKINARSWKEVARWHNARKNNRVNFFKNKQSYLSPELLQLLPKFKNKNILHLFGNDGSEAFSLANLGASKITVVDFQEDFVRDGQYIASQLKFPVTFVHAEVNSWLSSRRKDKFNERFDIVLLTLGSLMWVGNLISMCRKISAILKPNGYFVLLDFHPIMKCIDNNWKWYLEYKSGGFPRFWKKGVEDYPCNTIQSPWFSKSKTLFENKNGCYEFIWSVEDIVNCLIKSGLQILNLREYTYLRGEPWFQNMRKTPNGRFLSPKGKVNIPLMFGTVAIKKSKDKIIHHRQ